MNLVSIIRHRVTSERRLGVRGLSPKMRRAFKIESDMIQCSACDYFSYCRNKGSYKPREKKDLTCANYES